MPRSVNAQRLIYDFKFASLRIYRSEENQLGIIATPDGGIATLRDSIYPLVYGHVNRPPRNEDHADLLRSIALTVWARQDDPTPLSLAAGYKGRYQGGQLVEEAKDRRRGSMARAAVAEHKKHGAQKSQIVRLMMWALIGSVIVMGLTWLAVPVIGLLG